MDTPLTPSANSPNSYLDFNGLANLKTQAGKDPKAALKQTAQQFEGLFLQQMMKSMRDTVPKDDLVQSSAMDTFQGMFDKEVSVQMSKRSTLGLADMLVKAQSRHMDAVNHAAHALSSGSTGTTNAAPSLPLNPPAKAISLESTQAPLAALKQPGRPMALRRAQAAYGEAGASDHAAAGGLP